MDAESLKKDVGAAIDAMSAELLGLSHAIHGEPELALEEFKAAKRLSDAVEGHGIQVQREASLRKHATALMLHLFPEEHLQERVIGGIWFMARYGEGLPNLLVENAAQECPGHRVIFL